MTAPSDTAPCGGAAPAGVRRSPFDYHLPDELIAVHPPVERDGARLLVLDGHRRADATVRDLPDWLRPGDLLVVNDTRVLHARLAARRATGGAVEVLLLSAEGPVVPAMVRPGRRLREGEWLEVLGPDGAVAGTVCLAAPGADGTWQVSTDPAPTELMALAGHVPLPPYLGRADEPSDRERYQTVFAERPGAVAAPTAGLHLSEALIAALAGREVALARVTLHVGPGTFRNLRPEDLARGSLHEERYEIPESTADAIAACRGRLVAVGTTTTRALEAAALGPRRVRAGAATTDLFIRPGHSFSMVDGLLTNFHLPDSSLLMLVCAFAGTERVMTAYDHAVRARYRFYSYGDATLLLPDRTP